MSDAVLRCSQMPSGRLQDCKEEPCLDPRCLRECAARSLEASLQLVSRCCDMNSKDLEKWYRLECGCGAFDGTNEPAEVEDVLLEDVVISEMLKQAHGDTSYI